MTIDNQIALANKRLKAGGMRLSIQRSQSSLVLRGIFPAKPSAGRSDSYQQRYPLKISANVDGVKLAEKKAREIRYLLDSGLFEWEEKPEAEPLQKLISRYERHYFSTRKRTPASETTWAIDYLASFKKLKANFLAPEVILDAVLATEPDSKVRQRVCMAFSALARFAEIEIDLKPYRGNYSSKSVNPRNLPSDDLILEFFEKIPDRKWRWFYAVLATYGLRPHEAFHIEIADPKCGAIWLEKGKTGERKIWPFFPNWFERLEVKKFLVPEVSAKNSRSYSSAAGHYFQRLKLPFKLYDMRHRWAGRCLELGLDVSLCAQQMGHSVKVHTEVYQRWLGDKIHQDAFEKIKKKLEDSQ